MNENICAETIQTITINGRFDAHVVSHVEELLESYLEKEQYQLVVNLQAVNFIDTRALSLLVTGMKRCRQHDGDLRVCCLQQSVRIIFELTQLNRAFQIFDDEASAVNSFD